MEPMRGRACRAENQDRQAIAPSIEDCHRGVHSYVLARFSKSSRIYTEITEPLVDLFQVGFSCDDHTRISCGESFCRKKRNVFGYERIVLIKLNKMLSAFRFVQAQQF